MQSIRINSAAAIAGDFAPEYAPTRPWRSLVLGGFLAVSVVAHGILLLLPAREQFLYREGSSRGALQVRMTSSPAPEPVRPPNSAPQPPGPAPQAPAASVPAPQPEAAAKSEPTPTQSPPAAPAHVTRRAPQPPPGAQAAVGEPAAPDAAPVSAPDRTAALHRAAPEAPSRAEPDSGTESQTTLAARVRARLQDSLRAHFYYPRIARHRGWEGLVEVGLRVEANGRLSAIRILRTSGFAVLDRAALASIGRIAHLPGVDGWLGGHPIDMVLPVQYRLVDG